MKFSLIYIRARNILYKPVEEWKIISSEKHSKNALFREYAIPLIALCAAARIAGFLIFLAWDGFPLKYVLLNIFVDFFGIFLGTYLSAVLINEILPNFNTNKDIIASSKLVIYSLTALYISIIFANIIIPLSFLFILGLFGIYTYWKGISIILKTPYAQKQGLLIISVLIMIVIFGVIKVILGSFINYF